MTEWFEEEHASKLVSMLLDHNRAMLRKYICIEHHITQLQRKKTEYRTKHKTKYETD